MGYSFRQRKDGGFDFFDATGKKTNIESYTKNTGVNINQLRQNLANQGDTQSQRIVSGLPVQFRAPTQQSTPSVFKTPVVRTPAMSQSVSQPTIQAPKVYTPQAQRAYVDAKLIGTGSPEQVKQAIARTVDRKNSVKLDPLFKQGKSYEDIAKQGGFSIDEVRRYAERNHKGYGDQGLLGNATRAIGQFVGDTVNRGTGLVTRPFTDVTDMDKSKGEAELQQINRDYRSGNITPAAAMERANTLAGRYTTQKATFGDDGFIRIGSQTPLEFSGNVAQQGIDSASLLPVAGGAASGSAKIASAVGSRPAANALNKAASFLTSGAQTQATSKLANMLASRGVNPETANLVGNAITSNAKQSLVYGSAQTGADVASGRGITPESLAMNYGADFLMGAAPEIGLGTIGRGINISKTRIHDNIAAANPRYAQLSEALQSTSDPAQRAAIAQQMAHIRKRAQEGGFIGGQKATGYQDALKQGRVFTDTPDGLPRFEVSDENMRIKNPNGQTLGELIDHPELFKNYDALKDVKVVRSPMDGNGFYDEATNTLHLNKDHTGDSALDAILHETQHGIQGIEDFARGTSPEAAGSFDKYQRSAGETEARAVARRRTMTDAERYSGQPTPDVPKKDLIVNKNTGKALSAQEKMRIRNHPAMLELDQKFTELGDEIKRLKEEGRSDNYYMIVDKKKSQDMIIKQQDALAKKLSGQGMAMSIENDPLASLKQEALKYKTAEEFVKAQGSPLYRGGHTYDPSLVTDRGVSTATSKENAQWFAGGYGPDAAKSGKTIERLYLKPDSKILNLNDVPKDILDGFKKLNSGNTTLNEELALVNYAKKLGYDAIDLAPWNEAEVRVINKDAIRSKQQLTDLYTQAHAEAKAPKAQRIAKTEAPKTKSPEQHRLDLVNEREALQAELDSKGGRVYGNRYTEISNRMDDIDMELSKIDRGVITPSPRAPKQPTPFEQDLQKVGLGKRSTPGRQDSTAGRKNTTNRAKSAPQGKTAEIATELPQGKPAQQPQPATVKPVATRATPDASKTLSPSDQLQTPQVKRVTKRSQALQESSKKSSYDPTIDEKPPVVNEARRAMKNGDTATYGLKDSFDESKNVPQELKDSLGAFGNTRTVKSNKDLWQGAQKRVADDPATAMDFYKSNNSDEAVATGYALINRYMKQGDSKTAGNIAMDMAERALESGRQTQAYALMKRLTPEGSIAYVEKKVNRYLKENPKMESKVRWNDATRTKLYKMAEEVNALPEGRDRNLKIGEMQQAIDNIFPSSALDKLTTVWKAGLLTSLRTHERNMVGNVINLGSERIATAPGSLADRIMSLRTGKRTLVATNKGTISGAKYGASIAKDQIKTGIDVTNSNLSYNINHVTWGDSRIEKGLKAYTEGVFRPLGAEDKLFREAAHKNSLYNQAIAMAKTKKLSGKRFDDFVDHKVKNPTADMLDLASDDAGRATFTHDNVLGNLVKQGKQSLRNKKYGKVPAAIADFIVPFTQVPTGVASQLYAYSPAKLAKSMYDIGKVIITGDSTLQRKAAQGFGRSVVGTAVLGAGAYLSAQGLMTGQPEDDAEKAQWAAEGKMPNSVKVGDTWYQLGSIGPQTLILLAGAQAQKDAEAGRDPIMTTAGNLGKNFKDQTFLKGMSSALDAIDDPKRYANSFVESQATSFVPNIVKDVTKATDPNTRNPIGLGDKFKASLPGLSQSVPAKLDSYGQEVKNTGVLEMIDLFNSSKEKNLPEAAYIDALRKSTGTKDHVPTIADKSIEINGAQKKLTSQEYHDYQQYIGQKGKDFIGGFMNSPEAAKMSDDEKAKKIDSTLKDINAAAKIELFGNAPKSVSANVKSILNGNQLSYTSKTIAALPSTLNPSAKKLYETYDAMDTDQRKKWATEKNTDAEVTKSLQSWIGDKATLPEITNDVAKEWADYQKDYADGKVSKLKMNDLKKSILVKAFKSPLTTDEKEIGTLTKAELQYYYENGVINDQNISNAVEVEKQLFAAGLISKETLQRNLGLSARGYKTTGGTSRKSSGTRRTGGTSTSIASILAANKSINDTNNATYLSLSKLLGSTTSGRTNKNKIGREVTLKTISVKKGA